MARHESRLVTHQFPLRPGLVVPVDLPPDLTEAEAARLGEFVATLPIDSAKGTADGNQ